MSSNPSRSAPRANTGSAFLDRLNDFFTFLLLFERRFDPFFRPTFDAVLRDPIANFTTALINLKRRNQHLKIAEEKPIPGEEKYLDSIVSSFTKQMNLLWKPGAFERGGNTKTHGLVRGEFIVHDGLPEKFRHGIFAQPKTYRAWVRFSGPGPYITPDIEDVGFMSISIKLMGVPGPKLLDDEKFTQDMFGVSTPTFVTPDTKANAQLQIESVKDAQIFYFFNFQRPHILDFIMQSLWIKTQSSPFEAPYFSCVPYLLGEGQAMQYLGVAQIEQADSQCHDSPFARPTTICVMRWWRRSKARWSWIFVCNCKRIRILCRLRMLLSSGRNGFRRACQSPRCACHRKSSTRLPRWNLPNGLHTTLGIASQSTVRWEIKAVLDVACISSCRVCGRG